MNIINIGTDRKIFDPSSPARKRMINYGKLFDELHIVVFAGKLLGLKDTQIADNVWAYPTNSLSRFLYVHDAVTVGRRIATERNLYRKSGKTVVTSQDPFETGKAGFRLRNLIRSGFQIQVHTDFLSPHFASSSILNRIRVGIAKSLLPEADEIRVVSERIKKSILQHIPTIAEDKIDVVPIYADTAQLKAPPAFSLKERYSQFDSIILMASRLTREKNSLVALKAFKNVLAEFPQAGLVIVGSGPEEAMLKNEAKIMNIQNSVVFESWQNDLTSYYKTADIFLSASLYEGYGLTLVEAALVGLPVVTTDVGIVGDMLIDQESALVCPVGDAECLGLNIKRLILDHELRDKIKANAQEAAMGKLAPDQDTYLKNYQEAMSRALRSL
jgi:glycosyltransferase involved in cell wall biosynthesis